MAKKKPEAVNWKERELKDWNATTFRAYLKDMHEEHFGIPYVTNNYGMEGKLIKTMYEEHGQEITKQFIDRCMEEYKPTEQYPGINFAFMYSYMRNRVLPKLLKKQVRQKRDEKIEKVNYEELADYL